MTKHDVLNELSSNKEYIHICKKILKGNGLYKDLYQDVILIFLEYDEQKLTLINNINELKYLYVRILCNHAHSSTSPFHKKYRTHIDEKEYKYYIQNDGQCTDRADLSITAKNILEKQYWFHKELFNLYIEKGSIREIERETGIPRSTLHRILDETKEKIKSQMTPISILLILQADITALQYHRQIIPHRRLLKTHPDEVKVTEIRGKRNDHGETSEGSIDFVSDDVLQSFDIVIYLRQISFSDGNTDRTIQRLNRLGCKVILDIDDYWELPKAHPLYPKYQTLNVDRETIASLQLVDAVTTTTRHFKSILDQYNKSVTVLPNCISPDDQQFIPRTIDNARTRIGWIGGVHHTADIKMIAHFFSSRLWRAIEIKDKYQFCLGGFNYQPMPEPVVKELHSRGCNLYTLKNGRYDEVVSELNRKGFRISDQPYIEIEKIMTSEYKAVDINYLEYLMRMTQVGEHISFDKSYRRLFAKDINHYGELYNEVDVCIAPLVANTFNHCKSELKIVEAGWMGKPVIVSDAPQYTDWIEDGVNGFIVKESNNMKWFTSARKLILDRSLREKMGAALNDTIKKHFDIDKHNLKRLELYRSLCRK